MPCRVCKQLGCNSRNHGKNRCTICGRRGHNRRFHKNAQPTSPKTDHMPAWIEFSNLRTRQSSAAISQGELDIATRVLLQCREDAANDSSAMLKKPIDRTVQLTGIGKSTIASISASLNNGQWPQVEETKRGKYPRLDNSRDLVKKVNDTIEKLHQVGVMTTVKKIRKHLNFYHGIILNETFTTRLLQRMGYVYGRPGPANILLAKETEATKALRLRYLTKMEDKRQQGLKIVYVDESYVNKSHVAARCWLKKGSTVYVPSGKGPRFILVGAGSMDGWLYTKVFRYKDASTDYHKAMNGEHFEEIFTEMCLQGKERLGRCLFLLDNAAYHKRLVDERHRITYWTTLKAEAVKAAWAAGEVPQQELNTGPAPKTKKAIVQFIREHPSEGMLKVEAIAEEQGHEVLMLPPYRPELNAIETAWAVAKNYVADNNDPRVTFENLSGLIERGLNEVSLSTWVKLDAKVQQEELRQLQKLKQDQQRHEDFVAAHPDLQFTLSDDDSSSSEDEDTATPSTEEEAKEIENVLDGLSDGLSGNDQPFVDYGGSSECVDIEEDVEMSEPTPSSGPTRLSPQPTYHDRPEASHTEDDLIAVHSLLHLANFEE